MNIKSLTSPVTRGARKIVTRFPFLKRKRFYIPALILLVVVGSYGLFHKPAVAQFETGTVSHGDVVKIVSETGTVEPSHQVDLSFTGSGRIASVSVVEGQSVRAGQLIATLESARQYADLLSAQARLRQAQATANNSGQTLDQTKAQQDQLVENAHRELISGDLQAYIVSGSSEGSPRTYAQPTVSGTYACDQQGIYRLQLYPSSAQSGASFNYSGIESGTASVSTVSPVSLGSCGLYVTFPANFANNASIVWEIPVPNIRSNTYQARLNAYNAAVENRRLALTEGGKTPLVAAQVDAARADVLAAQAALSDTRLIAPFSGTITTVGAVKGAIASIGTPAASLISNNAFEISVQVPENDIGNLNVGDTADVTFDAYDSGPVKATVSYISPSATTATGAASFKVTLQFEKPDERIRAGLSANVDITAAEQKNVVSVPTRAVIEENGTRFVRVMVTDSSYREVPVTTGLSGGGKIEILTGLTDGERIITFANVKALATLKKVE